VLLPVVLLLELLLSLELLAESLEAASE